MTPERWDQLQRVYEWAGQLSGSDLDSYIQAVIRSDRELGSELKELLACKPQVDIFLEEPAFRFPVETHPANAVATEAELVGQTLLHYRVREKLASGPMGEVYLAEDLTLTRRPHFTRLVALKMIPAEFATDPLRMRLFKQEAIAASALNHPNVATIHELAQAGNRQFIVMEYVEGRTLAALLSSQEKIPIPDVLNIALQVAKALEAAHTKRIIHRDVKPANIMVNAEGHVKILDFGIAKLSHESLTGFSANTSFETSPESREIKGTFQYMSPEQSRGDNVDHRTDIFSLGIVLYEMLTGCLPFAGATLPDLFDQIRHSAPEPIRNLNKEVVPELESVVLKCLEKDADRRYPSVRDLTVDLNKLSRAQPVLIDEKHEPKRHNLPVRLNTFIGRRGDVATVCRLLSKSPNVVQLSGPAGIGKSCVAIQATLKSSSGRDVFYVDLAGADDAVAYQTIALVLGCQSSPEKSFSAIIEFFQSRRALLLLDNCDRVLVGCLVLAFGLIPASPQSHARSSTISVLLTSRVETPWSGLRVHRLGSLMYPKVGNAYQSKDIKNFESVRLFLDRAASAARFKLTDRNATAVADICRRLDGIPLAIELAAARLRTLSLDDLHQRLGLRILNVGTSGETSRHQGLHAAIEWSWEMLSEVECLLFNRLCIVEDWSLEAIEAVCAGGIVDQAAVLDLLTMLSDKSIVLVDQREGMTRYRLLQVLREYGLERLKGAGEYESVMSRFTQFYLDSKRVSLSWVHVESRNLRTALGWAAEHKPAVALAVAQKMWRLWFVRKEMIATALETIARQAFDQNRFVRACTLWTAAEVIRPPTTIQEDAEFRIFDRIAGPDDIASVRTQLDEAAFEQARRRGSSLSLDDAIEYALTNAD